MHDYLKKSRAAGEALVKGRYLLAGDLDEILKRSEASWRWVQGEDRATR